MFRLFRGPAFLRCVIFIVPGLPALAQVSPPNTLPTANHTQQPQSEQAPAHQPQPRRNHPTMHIVPWRNANAQTPFAVPAGAHLSYFGGPVISNVHVVEVLYGSGAYLPQVSQTAAPSIASFFSDITSSGFITLLSQFNTAALEGTNQTIGNGTFDGLFQITPMAANRGSSIDDTQIQGELLAQVNAGRLPEPVLDAAGNVNTVYMIYFPPGITITQGGTSSCVAGGFCAYHGTTANTQNSKNLLYGVVPDMQPGSGCSKGCGASSTFGNYTSVTSHELAEAITDPDVGIATAFGPPLAWYDRNHGEIGDICNAQQGSYVANRATYTIQLEFSNAANDCVLPPATPTPNSNANVTPIFSLSASPSSLMVKPETSGSSTVTVTPSGGFTGSVSLSTSALPSGVTASFGTNPTTSTGVLTFIATSTATTGTSSVTVTGTSGTLTNTTTISLTISAAAQQL